VELLRRVVRVVLIVVAAWAVVVLLAALFQRQLIYLPDRSSPSAPAGVEEVTLVTDDGLRLTAWFVPAGQPGPDREGALERDGVGDADSDDGTPPVSTILVAPGNAGNRALRLPLATALAARGHAVLLLDYRGYGGNPGRPSEDGLLADAGAALAYLDARADVDADRVVLLGESLGTGVVAGLVGRPGTSAGTVAADGAARRLPVVLRSPFTELADVGRAAYPFLPVRLLLRDRFPVVEDLRGDAGPVLVIAGDRDRIVPTALSREVAAALDAPFVAVEGADHNDRALLDGDRYLDAVDRFVREVLPPR
jgi:uncharacterized protein